MRLKPGRTAKSGINSVVATLLFLGILVIINVVSAQNSFRFDFTGIDKYTLSSQSISVLKNLADTVLITALISDNSFKKVQLKDLIDTYRYYSDKISYKFVDPIRNPDEANKYERFGYHPPKSSKDHQHAMGAGQFIMMELKGKNTVLKKLSEAEITSAMITLGRDSKKIVYFLEGHGEHEVNDEEKFGYSLLKTNLEMQGFKVQPLFLLKTGSVPSDASVLVVAGPRRLLEDNEKKSIKKYLNNGGKLLAMLDPLTKSGMEEIVSLWGFHLKDDVVFDKKPRVFPGRKNIPVVDHYYKHDITEGFSLPTFYPEARSISFDKNYEAKFIFQPFVATGEDSFARLNPEDRTWADYVEGIDQRGPIVTAASVMLKDSVDQNSSAQGGSVPDKTTQIVVFGDSDFATNNYLDSVGNKDLVLNTISWLAQEKEMISIRPKEVIATQLMLTPKQENTLFYITVVAIPALLLSSGVFNRWRRKRL